MKRLSTLVLSCFLLLAPAITAPVLFTGCSLFGRGTPNDQFANFKSTWDVSLAAYDAHLERVVLGKVPRAQEIAADAAWEQFRATFKQAFVAAAENWKAAPPEQVKLKGQHLIKVLTRSPLTN